MKNTIKYIVILGVMSLLITQPIVTFAGETGFITEEDSIVIETVLEEKSAEPVFESESGDDPVVDEEKIIIDEKNDVNNDIEVNTENMSEIFAEETEPTPGQVDSEQDESVAGDNDIFIDEIEESEESFVSGDIEMTAFMAAGNSISSATGISIGNTYSGSITSSNTASFYKFTINSSGNVTLMSTALIPWVYYRIYDGNGVRLWSSWYAANNTGQSSISEAFDLTKGTYYLGIEQYGSSYTGSYSFKLSFSSAGETFGETGNGINNTIATANNISIGTIYKGQIAKNDDKDFYKFTISSSGRITFSSTAVIPWIEFRVYDSTGEHLWGSWYAANSSGQISVSQILDLTRGTYYLGVEQYSSNYTGNYSFKIDFASAEETFTETGKGINNTLSAANNISTGTTYKGQIATNDEKDFYRFVISSTGKYTLTSSANIPWVYYRIYDSTGNCLWSSWYAANSSGQVSVDQTLDFTKGTYYLGVEQYSSKYTGNYSFKITSHVHNYASTIAKATTYKNGTIKYKCKCGYETNGIIYYPQKVFLSVTKYSYDGKVKTPSVTVKGSNGGIINSSNYTVSYSKGRKNVGRYTVLVTFKGNYTGSISKSFVINPQNANILKLTAKSKSFTVRWKKQSTQITGYQIQYSTKKNFSSKTTKTITKKSSTSATYKKLKGKKKYYVRIRSYKTVSGTKYYSSWSSAKVVTTKR